MTIEPEITHALMALRPNIGWQIQGQMPTNEAEFHVKVMVQTGVDENETSTWSSDPADFGVTWEQAQTKLAELQAAYHAKDYQRDRAEAYPSIVDQMDMQYWDSVNDTTTWKDAIAAVKASHPKP